MSTSFLFVLALLAGRICYFFFFFQNPEIWREGRGDKGNDERFFWRGLVAWFGGGGNLIHGARKVRRWNPFDFCVKYFVLAFWKRILYVPFTGLLRRNTRAARIVS